MPRGVKAKQKVKVTRKPREKKEIPVIEESILNEEIKIEGNDNIYGAIVVDEKEIVS